MLLLSSINRVGSFWGGGRANVPPCFIYHSLRETVSELSYAKGMSRFSIGLRELQESSKGSV